MVVTTIGAYLLGPLAVRLLFGSGFTLSRSTMALLAGASSVLVLAIALSGAAIAAGGHRMNALAWSLGIVGLVVGTMLSQDLFLRVELGYLLGSCSVAVALLVGLPAHIRRTQPVDRG